MRKRYSNQKGFTLIEVTITVLILGIVITPIFTMITHNIKMNDNSKKQIIATNIAERLMEEMKFSKKVKISEKLTEVDGFTVNSKIETVEIKNEKDKKDKYKGEHDLYRIVVEVKNNEEIIEKLVSYKALKVGSDNN